MDAQTFINQTLTLIGRLGPGRGAGPSESAQSLDMLNAMLASWNNEHLTVPSIYQHEYVLTDDKGTYSFGPGGDFAVTRFLKIQSAGIVRDGIRGDDLELITSRDYHSIKEKTLKGRIPLKAYNDNVYPVTTVHLWPVPTTDAAVTTRTIDLAVWLPLAVIAALTTPLDFPPGYHRAIMHALAIELVSIFPNTVLKPEVAAAAVDAKQNIQKLNLSNGLAMEDIPAAPPAA